MPASTRSRFAARIAAMAAAGLLATACAQQPHAPMTHAQNSAAEDTIEADYEAAKGQCGSFAGNRRDVCEKEAEGRRDVALAELENRYQPSADNARKVREAQAKADYEVADERCEEFQGDAKDACELKARSDYEAAKAVR